MRRTVYTRTMKFVTVANIRRSSRFADATRLRQYRERIEDWRSRVPCCDGSFGGDRDGDALLMTMELTSFCAGGARGSRIGK